MYAYYSEYDCSFLIWRSWRFADTFVRSWISLADPLAASQTSSNVTTKMPPPSAFDIPSRCSFRGRAQLWSRRTWTTCLSGGGHIGKVAYEYHSDWRMKPLNAAVQCASPPKKEMPRFQQRVTPRADVLRKLSTVGEKKHTHAHAARHSTRPERGSDCCCTT